VEKGQEVFVHRLEAEKGAKLDFDKVMLIDQNGKTTIGTPVIKGAHVKATIVEHLRGDKIFVFKKKRRKGYKKFNGHRQYLSLVKIEDIVGKAPAKSRAKKAEAADAEKAVATAKKDNKAKAKKAVATTKKDDKAKAEKSVVTEKKEVKAKAEKAAATEKKEVKAKAEKKVATEKKDDKAKTKKETPKDN
jgi:large subunit ribosomal protein L21